MEKIRALKVPRELKVGEMKKRMKRYLCVARLVGLGENHVSSGGRPRTAEKVCCMK